MLQYITDSDTIEGTHRQVVQALDGGCRWIQIRMKNSSVEDISATVKMCLEDCHRVGATLIINDHAELVRETGADGVHIGQKDISVEQARALVGHDKIIGLTINNREHALNAVGKDINYIGLGPWRYTSTKKNLSEVLGKDGVGELISYVRSLGISVPIVTIGGITVDDVADALAAGATGVAVSGTISRAASPQQMTARFIEQLKTFNIE